MGAGRGMHITFHGAVRQVTGSAHLVSHGEDRILLECGLFQGRRREAAERHRTLSFDPRLVTNVALSHAHIDHSGRLPVLARGGFSGRIFCTRATASAARYLLLDSAHIQETDARYLNYKSVRSFLARLKGEDRKNGVTTRELRAIKKLLKKDKHEIDEEAINEVVRRYKLDYVKPLYMREDAERAIERLDGFSYGEEVGIGRGLTVRFHDAGHILGSAFVVLKAALPGRQRTVFFSGDMGRFDKPIIEDPTLEFPEEDRDVDLMVLESTYGNREHGPVITLKERLGRVISETVERGGSCIIPSFAFGRTQEILYFLHELYNERAVPKVPVFVDSPLAVNLTRVFGEHPEVYDSETHGTFLEKGKNPFSFPQIRFVKDLPESMALMKRKEPHVVIAGSGMCEAGRVLHHFRYKIHDERNTVLVVGYMAANTLGRRLLELGRQYEESDRFGKPPLLGFLGKKYPLAARVEELGGFSAHADCNELLRLVKESNLRIRRIALVHGEEDQSLALAERLRAEGFDVVVPRLGETIPVDGE